MREYCSRNSRSSSMLLLLTLVVVDLFAIVVAAEPTAVVRTTTGPVQGEILTTVNSVNYAGFKGIRFAKPPLGYLRFKPPVPIEPWTETLNATVDGADCIQRDLNTSIIGSEDCLFLNVYTPVTDLSETPTNLKPVMAWIYGGAFTTGSSSSISYHPDYLLEKDVVVVAFNYRLGALGFVSLQHPNASGNAGLKDQLLALKWVNANIRRFGGDPNKITIFGESAGSVSVGLHILSDASTGLFQSAISMSGVPLNPWGFQTPATAINQARQLGVILGTTSRDEEVLLKTFYDASAEEITAATSLVSLGVLPFVPTLENASIATDAFLTKCSVDKYNSGNFTKVPQMLGFLDRETVTFLGAIDVVVRLVNEAIIVYSEYGLDLPDNIARVKDLLNNGSIAASDILTDAALQPLIDITTDSIFKAQIDQTQAILATKNDGKPVYYYHISFFTNRSLHNLQTNSTLLGPGHTDDLAYIFYYPEANYSTDPTDPTRRTINRMTTLWTNFAKYGNPTPSRVSNDDSVGITWPNSGILGRSLDIGTELTVGLRPTNPNIQLIQATGLPVLRNVNGCQ